MPDERPVFGGAPGAGGTADFPLAAVSFSSAGRASRLAGPFWRVCYNSSGGAEPPSLLRVRDGGFPTGRRTLSSTRLRAAHFPMHPISSIPYDLLRSWLDLVEDRSDRLLASHHLILGPELAGVLKIPEPSADSVIGVLRALRDREPDACAAARELARHSSPGRRALLEIAVDELLDTDFEWPHPALVLDPPRPELRDLLAACERRLRDAGDDERQHLRDVTRKVANAARIADEARRNRERLRRRRTSRRRRLSPP